jgi:hypothetical protein
MQEKNQFPELNRHLLTSLHPSVNVQITYWAPVGMLFQVLASTPIGDGGNGRVNMSLLTSKHVLDS